MSGATLSMAEVAARLGLHYDTLRKSWREKNRAGQLPAPVLPTRRPRWDAGVLEAWIRDRSLQAAEAPLAKPAAAPARRGRLAALRAAG